MQFPNIPHVGSLDDLRDLYKGGHLSSTNVALGAVISVFDYVTAQVANVITVAKSGGMFTTIQGAIDSANPIVHSGTAQAGGVATITLAATASAVDDYYNGKKVRLTGGTGSGQIRTIIDYDGTTKIATVDSNWTTPPDATTTYAVKSIQTVLVYSGEYTEVITLKDCVNIKAIAPHTVILNGYISSSWTVGVFCVIELDIYTVGTGLVAIAAIMLTTAQQTEILFKGDVYSKGGSSFAITITNATAIIEGNIIKDGVSGLGTLRGDGSANIKMIGNITILNSGGGVIGISTGNDFTGEISFIGDISTTDGYAISHQVAAGTVVVTGKISSSLTIPCYLSGAAAYIKLQNSTIICTYNNASGHGIQIANSNLILQNVKIVGTHASANSIYAAAAQNVYCMGVWANRDDHANITQMITGGFTYDADVI